MRGLSAVLTAILSVSLTSAADFHPPAGEHYAEVGAVGTILPGGRLLKPYGFQIPTGPGTLALAVSPHGTIATAEAGKERPGITIIEPQHNNTLRKHNLWAESDWKSVSSGIAFDSDQALWISEGASGRIRRIDVATGNSKKVVDLNTGDWTGSVTAGLAYDNARHGLYVLDPPNARVAVIDARSGQSVSSVRVNGKPSAIALAPDGLTLYVTGPDALSVIDVRDPLRPTVADRIPTRISQAVVATADRIYVSNALDDSITVISAADRKVVAEIPLRIPSLEQFRGIQPAGLAYDPATKWLLVAETGINAVGVVDTTKNQLIGHIPAGWMPVGVAISGSRVYVASGSLSTFLMPDAGELTRQTGAVLSWNGLVPSPGAAPKLPAEIRHVVLIVKENRTFDEVLGDVEEASNGHVLSLAKLARYGMHGIASGDRKQFSLQDVPITPNQHEIAHRWAFSDNFYADGDNLKCDGVTFQDRAGKVIAEIDQRYAKGGEPLPQFLCIHLPNDPAKPGYPYAASFVLDNDFATGQIVDYFSHSPWWRELTIFITTTGTGDNPDHIDSRRTLLFAAGPYAKKNYVSHTNSSYPGLQRTILELLHQPPLNLAEATAASLSDMFTATPDYTAFTAIEPDRRIFNPDPKK